MIYLIGMKNNNMKDIDKILNDWDDEEFDENNIPLNKYSNICIGMNVVLNPKHIHYKTFRNHNDIGTIIQIFESRQTRLPIRVEWRDGHTARYTHNELMKR